MYIQGKNLFNSPARVFFPVLFLLFFLTCAPFTFAATLRVSPSSVQVEEGKTVSINISLSSSDQSVNAVSGVLTYDPSYLEVTSLSKSSSVVGLWVREPSYSNSSGTVSYEGVILNPGYTGSGATVLAVRFRALKQGTTALQLSSSQALANDGSGTDILTGLSGGTVTITKATASPAPKPTQPKPSIPVVTPLPTTTQAAPLLPPAPQCSTWQSDLVALLAAAGYGFAITLLLLIIAALLGYLMYQRANWKPRARKELRHLDTTVSRALLLLRDDVERFVEDIHKESSKRKLTLIETDFIKTTKKNLAEASEIIKKEIDEVEDILG